MRKLKLQVQMTVDGYIAGSKGEMDWTNRNWDNKLRNYVGGITKPVDCIVLGRKLALGFIPYWASNPEEEGADKFNTTKKLFLPKHWTGWNGTIPFWQKATWWTKLRN